jgi:hypothetical protein
LFIHIGNDEVVLTKDVIMILDRYALISKDTSDFLQVAREEGFVVERNGQGSDKKSLIITDKKVVFSPISSVTLLKRADFIKKL